MNHQIANGLRVVGMINICNQILEFSIIFVFISVLIKAAHARPVKVYIVHYRRSNFAGTVVIEYFCPVLLTTHQVQVIALFCKAGFNYKPAQVRNLSFL